MLHSGRTNWRYIPRSSSQNQSRRASLTTFPIHEPSHSFVSNMSLKLLLTTLVSMASATQIFSNRGTLTGWGGQQTEHKGTLSTTSSVFFDQPPSIVAEQTYDPSYTGRYHSEVRVLNAYQHGQTRFYGFAFRLPDNWQFDPAQSYDISQFIAAFHNGCDDSMPSTMFWLEGRKLNTRLKTGSVCAQKTRKIPLPVTVTAGQWHKIVMEVKWTPDNSGRFKVWYDDQMVVNEQNVATTVKENAAFQFRVGLYANGWHDDKTMKGTQGVRKVFFDKIAIATTKNEADPSKW
ncbi:polysaccharide lyase [Podospora australis]|uniref:Polysaccharide lyase n=1 Tax=Podospora australis TaxID=1536484 RepID=A0AAN6WUK8_9PEZI|nr:polysaccharide lyase [Podospora australis]